MNPVILVVDDEEEIRLMLSRHFRFLDYDVVTASGVDEALALLAETRVDVAVCDIRMPGRSGVELLEELRHTAPMVKTIMMTGYSSLENVLSCMRLGAEACVFKPLGDLDELDGAVRRCLEWRDAWNQKLLALRQPGAESRYSEHGR